MRRSSNSSASHYIGNYYEHNVGTGTNPMEVVAKYYYAGMGKISRLLALRRGSTLYYVLPDHLGVIVRTVDAAGNPVDDIRYHTFSATRSGGDLHAH